MLLVRDGPAFLEGIDFRVLDLVRLGLLLVAHAVLFCALPRVDGSDHRSCLLTLLRVFGA